MPNDMPKVYEGDHAYIFVNYAHADSDAVLPIIATLVDEGYRVWYDAGIKAGSEFPDYIADHVYHCACFLMLISSASLASDWCKNELFFARKYGKTILPVYLEEVELTRGLEIQIGSVQALVWHNRTSDKIFYETLFEEQIIDSCLTSEAKKLRQTKKLWVEKANSVLESTEYSRQSYVEALNNLRSITRADEDVRLLIRRLEERIATEDTNRARAIGQAKAALNAENPSEGSLRAAIAALNSLIDEDEEIAALIGNLNDRLTEVEAERKKREEEEKRKAEEERKAAEERKAEEERLAREKAERERREREKAAAEVRMAQAIKRAEFALSEPKPSRRALRKALANLQSLPKGDHEVERLEQRIRSLLRSWNVRQVVLPFAVLAIVFVCIAAWPLINSALNPVQPESEAETKTIDIEPASKNTDDSQPEASVSGSVEGVDVKSGIDDYSWAELKTLSQAIAKADEDEWKEIAKEYNLAIEGKTNQSEIQLQGETKSLNLTDGTETSVRILGFRHDDLADGTGKAGITFEFADVPTTHAMNPLDSNNEPYNTGGWEKSEMRKWLNDEFFSRLPKELSERIVEVKKRANNTGAIGTENDTSVVNDNAKDKLWLLSLSEVYGELSVQKENAPWSPATYDKEGNQYLYYEDQQVTTTNYSSCIKNDTGGTDSWWWLRSPSAFGSSRFHFVDSDGDWGDWDDADYDYGVSPGFCF